MKNFFLSVFSSSSQVIEIVVEIHPLQRLVAVSLLSCFALNTFFRQKLLSIFMLDVLRSVPLDSRKTLLFNFAFKSRHQSSSSANQYPIFAAAAHTGDETPRKKVENHRHGECKKRKSTWRKENGKKSMQRPRNNTF